MLVFTDSYGFFAACRKIACLAILLAVSSNALAVLVSTPSVLSFGTPTTITFGHLAQEYSFLVEELTIEGGSTLTQWRLSKPEYGRADFVRSTSPEDVRTDTVTRMATGRTVIIRYLLLRDPVPSGSDANAGNDAFSVMVEDTSKSTTFPVRLGTFNRPPVVLDSRGTTITGGTFIAPFPVGGTVTTTVFKAVEGNYEINLYPGSAPYFGWSATPVDVGGGVTVFFFDAGNGAQITTARPTTEVAVTYKGSSDVTIADGGYTLVVTDTLGRETTVAVSFTSQRPVIGYEGSPVEDGELNISVHRLALSAAREFSFQLSAEYACPPATKCLFWEAPRERSTSSY